MFALMLQGEHAPTPDAVRRLAETAHGLGPVDPEPPFGAGLVDAPALRSDRGDGGRGPDAVTALVEPQAALARPRGAGPARPDVNADIVADETLIAPGAARDQAAIGGRASRVLVRLVRDAALAQNLLGDVFVEVWQGSTRVSPPTPCSPGAWPWSRRSARPPWR